MKKIIGFTLALVLLLGLAACGSSGSDEPEPSDEPAAEQEVEVDPATEEDVPEQISYH